MKKILFSILAALVALPSLAQYSSGGFSLSENNLYYGIRIGASFATVTGDDAPDLGTKAGLNLAGVIGLRVSDSTPVFLESGLYYVSKGAKKDKNTLGLNYLELPILIKYGIQATDDIAVLPFVGPTFGFGIAGKWNVPGYGKENSFGKDKFSRADVGIKLGCGAEYNKLYLELGYQFGITNIANWQLPPVGSATVGDDAVAHNGSLFVNFGVNF